MDFSLFLLALYQLWDNFLTSEMTSIGMNNTTKNTPCQPQSVHCLGMLIAENVTLPQWRDFRLRTRCIWDLRFFWDFTHRRLVVFCRRFETTVGGCEIPTAVLVKIQVIWDVAPCWLVNLPSSSGSTIHRNVMSHGIEDHAGPSYCVWRVFYVKTIAACTKAPYWTHFSFRALWYIKTVVNTNKYTILPSVYSFCYM